MKYFLLIILTYCPLFTYAIDNETKQLIKIQNKKIIELEIKNKELTDEVISLKIENSQTIVSIDDLKEMHKEQIIYYDRIINTIIWIVSIIFLLISISFSVLFWFFKKPDELWKKLSNIKNDANRLLEKLEKQIQHQKAIFIFGEKGLYLFTPEDWNIIKNYALKSKDEKVETRSAYDWYFMGLWEYKQKKFPLAIEYLTKATEIDTDFEIGFKDLGNAYEENNDLTSAIKCYEKMLKINPLSSKALNNLGIAFTSLNEFEKARDYFYKSLKIDPKQGFTYTNIFELDLILNKDFDSNQVKTFEQLFKFDKKIYATYEMLSVFKQITKDENVDSLLNNWKDKNYKLGSNEDYREIEKWINNVAEKENKENLLKALNFFKGNTEL